MVVQKVAQKVVQKVAQFASFQTGSGQTFLWYRKAPNCIFVVIYCFKCAHVATCLYVWPHVAACCPHFAHIFQSKFIRGNCGTSVMTPFVLTPSGSFQEILRLGGSAWRLVFVPPNLDGSPTVPRSSAKQIDGGGGLYSNLRTSDDGSNLLRGCQHLEGIHPLRIRS